MNEKRPTVPDWLRTMIVASLGIYFVIGAIAWTILALNGRTMPDSFATILATIAGGLVGVLTPTSSTSADGRSDGEAGVSKESL